MDDLLELSEKPTTEELYLIAGWRQWADAGATSSALPQYLIDQTRARKIGEIKSESFYIFQLPGTHSLFRPEIKLEEGYRAELKSKRNEIFYSGNENKGLLIFLGDEPHLRVERYAEAFFNIVKELKVKRVAVVGGVYGPSPYDRDREISCTYSLRRMKDELTKYAVQFSNYEGGVSIGSYLADRAEKLGIECLVLYAVVPMYDFSQLSPLLQAMMVEQDYKAWYDVMRRLNHMFRLGLDLSNLERESRELIQSIGTKIGELEKEMPQVHIREFLDKLAENFTEPSFMPLDDVWEKGLGDLFRDL
jgi:proteasome assembly chaperone (PAC2) family protein